MKKAVIWGAGYFFEINKEEIFNQYKILAIIDTDIKKIGTVIKGIVVQSPDIINKIEYDVLIIAILNEKISNEKAGRGNDYGDIEQIYGHYEREHQFDSFQGGGGQRG